MAQRVIDGTKVTMGATENCISFQTFSRKHRRSSRFFVAKTTLSAWLERTVDSLYDSDIGNFLRIRKDGEMLRLQFTWLDGDDYFKGYREYITLPVAHVQALLECEKNEVQYLHMDRNRPSHFDFRNAERALKECIADKRAKRALSKALRDCRWHDTTVTMYNDSCHKSFFFRERGSWNMEGGLILHKGHTDARAGEKFPKVYYSVHT